MKKLRPGLLCGRESEASLLACGRQAAHSHEYYNEFPHVRVLTRMPKQFLWIKSSIPEVCLPSRIMVMFVEFSFGVCFAILRRFICLCSLRSPVTLQTVSLSALHALDGWVSECMRNEEWVGRLVGALWNHAAKVLNLLMPLLCHATLRRFEFVMMGTVIHLEGWWGRAKKKEWRV